MCTTCGCAHPEQVRIGELPHGVQRGNAKQTQLAYSAFHAFSTNEDLTKPQSHSQVNRTSSEQTRLLKIEQDVLGKNNQLAQQNRQFFQQQNIQALNLVSSPGSGKTSLLVATLNALKNQRTCYVIEGDQQTENDAERIRATGVPALQVNTGKGCHLDAQMIQQALPILQPEPASLLFIENVGNLVCPAEFDLGEKCKVVILSVTEGEDKPLKYPHMFSASKLMILNKIDLLPYLQFDVQQCIENAKSINPNMEIIQLSATTGEGLSAWLDWLQK